MFWQEPQASPTMLIPRSIPSNGFNPSVDYWTDDGVFQANICATTYGINGGGIFHGRLANGTRNNPSAVTAGQIVGGIGGRAWESGTNGFQQSSPASIHFVAAENQSNTNRGSYLRFLTTPNGAATRQERFVIAPNGIGVFEDTLTTPVDWTTWNGFGANVPDVGLICLSGAGGTRSTSSAIACVSTAGTAGSGCGFRGLYSGGNINSPAATPTGKSLCFMGGGGHDGTQWTATKALLNFISSEAWSATANGTRIELGTTRNGTTVRTTCFYLENTGDVVAGNKAAIATNAVDGFLYVPTCAGTPTGTPTGYTGKAPIVVDTTNNKLYFYSGGAWRDAGP